MCAQAGQHKYSAHVMEVKRRVKIIYVCIIIAVGSVVNLLIHPTGALIIGSFAGAISVLGYRYLTVKLLSL
jgi:hypothetical protein